MDNIELLALLFGGVAVLAVLWLGPLPGRVAARRRHTAAAAIRLAGWLGLVCGVLPWLLAYIWAHTQDNRPNK